MKIETQKRTTLCSVILNKKDRESTSNKTEKYFNSFSNKYLLNVDSWLLK